MDNSNMIKHGMLPADDPHKTVTGDFADLELRVLAQQNTRDRGTKTGRFDHVEAPPARPMLHPIWPVLLFVTIMMAVGALGFCLGRLATGMPLPSDCPGVHEVAPPVPSVQEHPVYKFTGHRYVEVFS